MKVAITGTGFMGATHAEALKRLSGVEVIGIHGSSPEKSRRAAEQLELSKAYEDYQQLLADSEVGAVHITTPNRLHYQQCVDALKAGKHVLCEKPLAMNSRQSAELVKLAQETDLVAGVNYNIRFYPMNQEARQRVTSGEAGEVLSVFGSYVQDWLLYDTDYNWRVLAEEGGELRAVADIGTHWLDLVQSVTGQEITAVMAELHTVHSTRKRPTGEVQTFSGKIASEDELEPITVTTDDLGMILLQFANGGRGCLFVSQTTAGRKNCLRYEISGSQSAVAWNSEAPNQIWLGHRDRPNETLLKDPSLLSSAAAGFADYPGGHNEGFPDTFKMCFRAFYDSIAKGEVSGTHAYASFADGHREIVLCEAILQSHREQGWVQVRS